ncbi:LacI family DNA-binding transcriptional regulator [Rhizomonospora bruguierae]|uniref:LacI family DNA-binding transcriptional regulator n=1 Tax=Rhizomonospora bruguierae TaxID=1581705 RepID=UPI001BD04DFD|nr:LacI family DNA-binding transcriptional regulator [Micromonospora sp. NBRC 107566]
MTQRMHRQPTLKSIAAAAGVHPSTASRALNGHPDARVPPETLARIQKVARELGYEPNPWARSLRTQRTTMIGLVIPRLTDVVLAQMFEAAEERARILGYQAITVNTFDREESQREIVNRLIDRRVDGLVLATPTIDDQLLPVLAQDNFPFVLLNRAAGDHPSVRGDDELGGYLATRHLLEAGHRRIGHLAGPLTTSTGQFRLEGYKRALREFDVRFAPGLVRCGRFDAQSGLAAAEELLATRNRPTAVFAINDVSALATMAAARRRGLRVPDDLAVVGYNDSETAALLPIPLTSVHVPLPDMGHRAVELLIDRINGAAIESVVLPPRLVVRDSSARPAGAA